MFKNLNKMQTENKKRVNLNASQFLALDVISTHTKKWKENRRQKQFMKTINQRQLRQVEEQDLRLIHQQRKYLVETRRHSLSSLKFKTLEKKNGIRREMVVGNNRRRTSLSERYADRDS